MIKFKYLRFFLVYGTVTHIGVVGLDAFQNELDFQFNGFSSILKHQSNQFLIWLQSNV